MKKVLIIALYIFLGASVQAQIGTCCSPAESFASLADNSDFVTKHPDPLPFSYVESMGHMITFTAADGKDANAYVIEAKEKTNNYLIVFHEWWGLNDYIKQMADKLYTDIGDINIIAPDLYDGKVATTQQDAKAYMQAMDTKRCEAIIDGIKTKMGSDARVATIGWCMGGAWSLQASLRMQDQAIGCVMYYGMPEENMDKLKTLNAPVLFILASQDKFITPALADKFEKDMHEAGKQITLYAYDADHGFANPSNPKHNAEATEDAYKHTLEFLKKALAKN